MARKLSMLAPEWWDFTTLEDDLLMDAARLTPDDLLQLSRPGFKVVFYDTLEDFYLADNHQGAKGTKFKSSWRSCILGG